MLKAKFKLGTPVLAILIAACPLVGCGRTDVAPNGSGGRPTTASGGESGLGGAISSGGGLGLGGAISSGGSVGKGGAASTGGNTAGGGSGGQTVAKPRVPSSHRPQANACVGVFAPAEPYNPQYGDCKKHADCTLGTNGRCVNSGIGMAANRYYCVYDGCATDRSCDPGKVCYCTASASPRCLSLGNCQIDADCGGGAYSYCSPSNGYDCSGYHSIDSYYCHTPKDTCVDNSDCTGSDYCNYSVTEGRWKCTSPNMNCAIG